MSFKTSHTFGDISSWSHDLFKWAKAFKVIHGVYPNILLASNLTYKRIDIVAHANGQENIKNPEGKNAEQFVAMSGFSAKDFMLEFCVDDEMEDNSVKLIYANGSGGGEYIDKNTAIAV